MSYPEKDMDIEDNDFDELIKRVPRSLLKRTLVSDYLLSKGYLLSDLEMLPNAVARGLMVEACLFATRKLVANEARENFYEHFNIQIHLN